MSRATLSWTVIIFVGFMSFRAAGQNPPSPTAPVAAGVPPQRALLDQYCVTCHNDKLKTAGLSLDNIDVGRPSDASLVWEKVIRKLRTGAMPPAGRPRPDQAGYDSLATYLETALDTVALAKPDPGRPTIHRLNRTEYANAVRDLLALDIEGDSLLPPDDAGYGFDNNSDVLSVSPSLLDRYTSAARYISRLAIGDPTIRLPLSTYNVPRLRLQDDRTSEDLPFGSRGGIAVQHYFPLDGEYLIRIRLQYLDNDLIQNLSEPHQLDVRLDGARIKLFSIGAKSAAQEYGEDGLEVRFQAQAGTHLVGVAFRNEGTVSEGMLRPPFVQLQHDGQGQKIDDKSDPAVDSISIGGPFGAKAASETPSRRKVFVCRPTDPKDEDICAKKILSTLLRRAYRRPVTDSDLQGLLRLYQGGRNSSGFEAGIGRALQGILLSSQFLFREERDPANAAAGTVHRVSDVELASRLSFFLWSSIPDDQLLSVAEAGKLKDPLVLEQQVRRLLHDSRSKTLVDNFVSQWLNLRAIQALVPDPGAFPEFDDSLREAFQTEAELFFRSMLLEDRSLLDLLNANYTFVNGRLARHYGIPNVYGSRFRRVTLADENRWGLLGKGAILMVTSYPGRTSPVVRGKWVLENILGTPPPQPPANVPPLDEGGRRGPAQRLTLRQRMEQHRASPACASCHVQMDPIGFALENYDAIGRWRATEQGVAIDASGVLPNGTQFQGPTGLRKILLSHPDQFATTFAEKLLTYALGRGVEDYDQPAIRAILREARSNDYRWSAFIIGIVKSVPFQMRRSVEQTANAGPR
jgi:mono/diheme cytochrome c family protein